jgi:hypothetical protein
MNMNTIYRLILAIAVSAGVFAIGYVLRPDLFGSEEVSRFGIMGKRGGEVSGPAIGGELVYAEGGVEHRHITGSWMHAETGIEIRQGDTVETLDDGLAIILLDDGSVLRMNSNSQIKFMSLNPSNMKVQLVGGEVYSRVAPLERDFCVMAGENFYKSLGTAYSTVYEEYEKGVKVFHSKVRVTDSNGQEVAVVDEGKKLYLKYGSNPEIEGVVTDISDIDIEENDFLKWNIEEDKLPVKDSKEEYTSDASYDDLAGSSSSLSVSYDGDGIVSWDVSDNSPKGYKVVWSRGELPQYPTRSSDKYEYYADPMARYGSVYAFDGAGMYYVRVCEYLGSVCGAYSNQIAVDLESRDTDFGSAKAVPTGELTSITVMSDGGKNVTWVTDGSSSMGYKVVWSKVSSPTYPTRSTDKYIYLDSPTASSAELYGFDGAGTYHVRVCEYLGGKCGVYSNELTVSLEKK